MDTTCNAVIHTRFLNCSHNNITTLEGVQYFDTLFSLNCNYNQLTTLPPLPSTVGSLYCDHNQIVALPALPQLVGLYCNSNLLTQLPILPYAMMEIACDSNLLTNLLNLPSELGNLSCSYNQITSISSLPSNLMSFICHDNPNLNCLPALGPMWDQFYFYNTGITCLPNYPSANIVSSPPLNSVPLCDSANINGCSYCRAHFTIYPDSLNAGVYYGFNHSYGSNLTSYLWEFGDSTTSTQQYPSHTYAQPGQYYVCLTVSGPDCTNIYCDSSYLVFKNENGLMSQLNILEPTGISKSEIENSAIAISPHPFTTTLSISLQKENLQQADLTITDVMGSIVFKSAIQNSPFEINLSYLPAGVYFLQVTADGERSVRQLVKQ